MFKRISFMNTYVDTLTFSETIFEMEKIVKHRKITQHVVINANKINLMYKSPELRAIINQCTLINADGQSVVWANRLLNNKYEVHRVTGIDLFEKLIEISAEKGYRVYYLGAKEEIIKKLVLIHSEKYPGLKIAGYQNGYFDHSNCEEIVKKIYDSHADILFVAFPSPQKEFWLNKHKEFLNVPLQIGVGGSFDVVAGRVKRAPIWVQKSGMEWFYRWIYEPRRLFKRYFIGNSIFIYHLMKEKWMIKMSREKKRK
ncbi:WecB/TagA/CpsF family glycosyltransferase [Enterococcus faecalis]|uniref:WecB/TagA/CpsF family glycosyltransferase n=1 Tax=Enterococcus faecalis TaxID=1351 RepID=UPI00115C54BF|nr:WecB/TagA/CpsF family glycosyltransferase [Enterococcus faecalis]EGO5829955.1 WecB/TagA/CpsF family glycosyltransferase [Enterococcus faecalis]EGO6036421.1 WecB/TagA/CpsF family glycosyltransferase [Enterococcus faecalis]EGO8156576.1 WecB/TagA/CpsF family glycosyltransferase [Enterococcus faecalis]EGO8860054.1 glycosyltransferase [Enterococcus faecalis]EHH1657725.1 WecB/TagA/CpsF family glycosyltransferase [Enterococcus faecalis]